MPPDYVYGDWALAVITTFAMLSSAWRMTERFCILSPGRWLLLTGWSILSVRMWWLLLTVGDAPIHPVALIALALIGMGHTCVQVIRPRTGRPSFR